MLSTVRLSFVCLSVTFVDLTQPVEIFGNVSMPFGTLQATCSVPLTSTQNFTEIVQGESLRREGEGVKRKRGSQSK